jgi:hypothetical protein
MIEEGDPLISSGDDALNAFVGKVMVKGLIWLLLRPSISPASFV